MSDEVTRDVVAELRSALADRYRIEREIGMGGMATVLLAHDLRHDRDVAIKVLHPDLGAALGSNRFLSEIRTTAKLQHPHILPLMDSGEADGLLYYVMPYVTGETLRTRVEREHQLPVETAVRIASEVADALGYAHSVGIIHRDIKPENILLQGGHALVADFGIALAVQSAGGQRMTQTGLSLGTPQYMSPEQAMGERAIDARSDIYALGAVTYEMLTGEPPFTGPTVQAIVARLLSEEPRSISTQRKAVPEHVEGAVFRALEKLPADRFATAAEFGAALSDSETRPTGVRANRRHTGHTEVKTGRPSGKLIAAGLALVAAGAIAGWAMTQLSRRSPAVTDALTVTSILAPDGGSFAEQRSLALSPDGRQLVFVFASADGSRMLWLRRLDRLEAEPVARTRGAVAPFWSPDGRSLGYFTDGYLTVLDDNGETRRICPASNPTGGSWSSSGMILFGHSEGLSTVPAAGDPRCRLVVPRGPASSVKGQFLPDGKRILYSRGRELDMAVADLEGKLVSTLPLRASEFAFAPPGYLVFSSRTDARAVDAQRFNVRALSLEGPVVRIATSVRSSGGVHTFAVAASGGFAFLPGSADRPYLEYDAGGVLRDTLRVEGTWTLSVRPR
ncbi:MAG TPA: protein kinase, partial [Gemmatimonadaceae bacterium]|nr:protein kinase [Gemmatimonadaceae bacterium]